MRKKQKVIIAGILAISLAIVVGVILVPPPIDGYYRCHAMTILDGSTGFVELRDGKVWSVNSHTVHAGDRSLFGQYDVLRRNTVQIHFALPILKTNRVATVSWLGLHWQEPLVEGLSRRSPRVWNPRLKARLDTIERTGAFEQFPAGDVLKAAPEE